jgi:hypothetical protein
MSENRIKLKDKGQPEGRQHILKSSTAATMTLFLSNLLSSSSGRDRDNEILFHVCSQQYAANSSLQAPEKKENLTMRLYKMGMLKNHTEKLLARF